MPKIAEILPEATRILHDSGVGEARREAASLLGFAVARERAFLVAHPEYELSADEENLFRAVVRRRAAREPLQYITGRQEFYGLEFNVAPGVLIPRPETESIVENALKILKSVDHPVFCEVGVGSGCISVSILHELETARGIGLDVSDDALAIAAANARKHGVAARLILQKSDVFEVLENEKFDLVVSNPPYIPVAEMTNLQREVRDYEPRAALTDGGDGFSIIEKIVAGAPRFLNADGFLLIEIGFGQAERAAAMFDAALWRAAEILPDLQGIPRTVRAQIKDRRA